MGLAPHLTLRHRTLAPGPPPVAFVAVHGATTARSHGGQSAYHMLLPDCLVKRFVVKGNRTKNKMTSGRPGFCHHRGYPESRGPCSRGTGDFYPQPVRTLCIPCRGLLTQHPELLPVYFTSTVSGCALHLPHFTLRSVRNAYFCYLLAGASQQPVSPCRRRRRCLWVLPSRAPSTQTSSWGITEACGARAQAGCIAQCCGGRGFVTAYADALPPAQRGP